MREQKKVYVIMKVLIDVPSMTFRYDVGVKTFAFLSSLKCSQINCSHRVLNANRASPLANKFPRPSRYITNRSMYPKNSKKKQM